MPEVSRAIQNLDCHLECENRDSQVEGKEAFPDCMKNCDRWHNVQGALGTIMSPDVQFEDFVNVAYLSDDDVQSVEADKDRPCFIKCSEETAKELKKSPPECFERCELWKEVKKAVEVIKREVSFDKLKDYAVQLHLNIGTDVSHVMFIRLFPQPSEQAPAFAPRMVIPKEEMESSPPRLHLRLCQFNLWMVRIRYILGALLAVSTLILQFFLKLDFPYIPLYAISLATIASNAFFSPRLKNKDNNAFGYAESCKLCTPNSTQWQIINDFVLLFALVSFSGGLSSPANLFFFPHIIFSSLLLSRNRAMINTSAAIILFGAIVLLQYLAVLPETGVSKIVGIYLENTEILLMIWLGFAFYATIIHYFTLSVTRELKDWQKEFLTMHGLLKERNKIFSELNKRLQRMDAIRKRMVHTASHDLKSPLAAVESYLKVMLGGYYGDLKEKQIEALQKSVKRLEGMRNFINEILDVASIEKEGLVKELTVVDVTELVAQVKEDNQWLANDKKMKLVFNYPERIPDIITSQNRFLQVLQNLVGNAIKFTPEGGEVTVNVQPGDDEVLFSVTDTGEGIDKEDLEKLFVEFSRMKRTQHIKGTGLGLYIVKSIINAHKGKIWVESEIGKGTTFFFNMKRANTEIQKTA